jgi:hypothetical protein
MTFASRNLFLAFVVLLLQASAPLRAQQMGAVYQHTYSVLSGTSIAVGASLPLTYVSAGEQSVSIRNTISLILNEQSSAYLPANFTASVNLSISYGASSRAAYPTTPKTTSVSTRPNMSASPLSASPLPP